VARQPEGPPPPPVVQRLRVRYAKRDRLRFTSHRDFARAFERALRRAGVPMAYSAGFSPHPKVSYAGAAPTGVASEAEYLEIALADHREPEAVREALDAALPPGLDVLEVVEAAPPALADRIEASHWRIELPDVRRVDADRAVAAFLALAEAPVEKRMKDGPRTVDARGPVLALRASESGVSKTGKLDTDGPCAILDVVVRHVTPTVRPDDVLTALRQAAALTTPVTPRVTRLAQGLLGEMPPADAQQEGFGQQPELFSLRDPLRDVVAPAATR
jgi:radical SAM-linked protein